MRAIALLLTIAVASLPTVLCAASLQVAPVNIEVQAPGATATLKLRNEGPSPINAQLRVFRWSQTNGEEKLEPTDDVVASPPIVALMPKTDYTVRLVRVTKRPLPMGESYRLFVDELPEPKNRQNRAVTVVLRYSIPVFFYQPNAADARLAWSIDQRGGRLSVSATNSGHRHMQIAALQLRDRNGRTISFGYGLTGYALGGSTMRWSAPGTMPRLDATGSVVISARGNTGAINVSTSVHSGR